MKKLISIAVISVTAGGIGFYLYGGKLFAARNKAIPAEYVAKAERRDIDYTIDVTGDVAPESQLDVKSQVGGFIKALRVIPGQVVKKNQVLCEIDDTDLQNAKSSALTEVEGQRLVMDKAQKAYDRGKELFAGKLITKETFENLGIDLDIAKNGLIRTQRALRTIQDELDRTKIYAPSDGTVLTVPVIEGQVVVAAASVNSGTTLMTLADLSKLLVNTHVNQVDVTRLRQDQTVDLTLDSAREEKMRGKIVFIAPIASIKNNVKGFDVQALISKPTERLRPGMTVSLTIPVAHASDAISVPIAAVFKGDNDKHVVYVLTGEDQKPEPRDVSVGITNLDYAEIKSGVKPGEQILTVQPRALDNNS